MLLESSDEQLVELVLGGDEAAFEVLFERHVADSLWFAREMLGSWEEAEEAVRHSFAAAHAYLAARGRETEFVPWLHTILSNHCLSMLQARAPGPGESRDAAVIDLDEWRRRRKLLGAALPMAPSAGLHDSVMAACGIGAGTATAGAPLLAGTLAKVAVLAVLASGAGVAGNVASDRTAPADGGTQATVAPSADAPGGPAAGTERESSRPARRTTETVARRPDEAPRTGRERSQSREDAPDDRQPPSAHAAPVGGGTPSTPSTAPAPATAEIPAAAPSLVPSALRRVGEAVDARPAVAGALAKAKLPDAVGLSKIGDDLGVASVKLPVDVRALSRGANVPSK